MPKVMKVCKTCGKEYEACHTPNPGVWRWRDFACSYECAMQYIHDVQVARGEIAEEPKKAEPEAKPETKPESKANAWKAESAEEPKRAVSYEPADNGTTRFGRSFRK